MEFKVDINLKQIALLKAALSIWEQESIKNETEEFFCSKSKLNNRDKWYNIIRKVIKKISPAFLPAVLYCELLYTVKHVGIRMYEWFRHLRKTRLFGHTSKKALYENYTKQIYWTSIGTIDEVKTLKLFWLNNPNANISKVYNMACCYCLEEHINSLWKKIPRNIQLERYSYASLYRRLGLNILAYWDDIRNSASQSLISDFLRYMEDDYDFYNLDELVEENMLKLCAAEGYHVGLKYFWNKLDDGKKKNNVVVCWKKAMEKYMNIYSQRQYRKDRYIEICLFLFQHLTESMKKELFTPINNPNDSSKNANKYLSGMKDIFIECWPWQNYLLPALDDILKYFSEKEYIDLFRSITYAMQEQPEFHLPIQNSEMQRKCYQLWHRIPSEYKVSVANEIIQSLFEVWDVLNIKLILNDVDLAEERQVLLKKGCKKFLALIKDNQQELIKQFFCEILVSKRWEAKMQNIVATLYKYLIQNDLDSVKCLLNAKCNSAYEKGIFKRKIDAKFVCYYFIKKEELDEANNFLFWKFETAEKVKNFKNHFKHDQFSKDHIFNFWTTSEDNLEIAVKRSDNYLKFIFETEEEISLFKTEKLKRSVAEKDKYTDGYKILRSLFIDEGHFEIIEHFLSWCSLSATEIRDLKEELVSEIMPYRCEAFIKTDEIENAEKLVNWAFDDEYRRVRFIREFSTSSGGLLALKYFIGVTSAIQEKPGLKKIELIRRYTRFIDFWIKPLTALDVVEEELASWKKLSVDKENEGSTSSEVNNIYDSSSSFQSDSEMSDDEDGICDVYCQRKKFDLFMKLLNALHLSTNDSLED